MAPQIVVVPVRGMDIGSDPLCLTRFLEYVEDLSMEPQC